MIRNKSPKALRIAEKKRRTRQAGEFGFTFGTTSTFISASKTQKRQEKLPAYDEYNPRRVHVARRREISDAHYGFPRGWTFDFGSDDFTVDTTVRPVTRSYSGGVNIGVGETATLFKDTATTWYINGENIS